MLLLLACASNTASEFGEADRQDLDLTGAIAASGGGDDTTTTTPTTPEPDTTTTSDTTGCGPADLDFTVEARASDDLSYQAFFYGETIDIVAVFENGCADDIVVSAAEDCLGDELRLKGDDGSSSSDSLDCAADVSTIAPGGYVENRYELGDGLGVGSWIATVTSSVLGEDVSVSFTVQ